MLEEGGAEPTVALLRRLAAALDADVRLTAGHDLGPSGSKPTPPDPPGPRGRDVRCMQDGPLDAFGHVNPVPEHETEQPRNVPGGLPGGHEHRRAEGALLAAQADAAGPAALMFWYQSDSRPKFKPMITICPARNARTGVWRTMPDWASMLQAGRCGIAGQAQGHRAGCAARLSCERPRECHRCRLPWRDP